MDVACMDLMELQLRMREGIEDIFPSQVWVKAEIASVQAKANGHCYIDLCQNENGRPLAKAKAVIWRSRYIPLMAYFREATGGGLAPGMEILARVQVTYSELYGLTLTITELEPQMTVGAAELERRRTIQRLTEDGMMDRQKSLETSILPYRLAVISARDAAGFGDFCRHIEDNPFGFAFDIELFEASMQGADAPASVSDAIACVEACGKAFDAILIMRGGGSALDLACFDDYGLCLSIAGCSIPVYTAIGHERDYHIADMVAYDFVKTPTALADRFIDAVASEDERISSFSTRLRLAFIGKIAAMNSRVDMMASRIRSADPRNILSRGYALVTDSRGVVVKNAASIKSGDRVRIMFEDGLHTATID